MPALLAMSVPASLWATGVGAQWWGYSALVQGAVLGASPLAARELRPLDRFAPAYALTLVVTPVALLAVAYEATPWHGTAIVLLAALTILWVGLRTEAPSARHSSPRRGRGRGRLSAMRSSTSRRRSRSLRSPS